MDKNTLPLTLLSASDKDAPSLYAWFTNIADIRLWGGPSMDFPISLQQFIAELKFAQIPSYKLVDEHGNMLAFGQYYARLGRCHLARLVVHPDARGKGIGKQLITQLMASAPESLTQNGFSLFLMPHNKNAKNLYKTLGFKCVDYPQAQITEMANCDYMITG